MFDQLIDFIRSQFPSQKTIPLHEPRFFGNERKYVLEAIDSTFVSTAGPFVPKFESKLASVLEVDPDRVVAVVNGTNALQMALRMVDVVQGDLVLTQALTFVATCNAIRYLGADPVFIDVEEETLGLSPLSMQGFLEQHCVRRKEGCFHKDSGRRIRACVPMHTFGHPVRINNIIHLCNDYGISLVEDAAESLGSTYQKRQMGTFGEFGILSFNGNKIVTSGGGGAIVAKNAELGRKTRHLATTAKINHPWAFVHDEVGYNFRMPNLNAALACAQLENLDRFVQEKRELALAYAGFFEKYEEVGDVRFVREPADANSNYWLNAMILGDKVQRDQFLQLAHENGVHCRPVWEPMHRLRIYKDAIRANLSVTEFMGERIVNLPSSAKGVI